VPVAQVRVEDSQRPGQDEDDEVGQIIMKQELEERPFAVAEDGVPCANDEIEALLTPAAEESEASDE
jgi:hypothetical protein